MPHAAPLDALRAVAVVIVIASHTGHEVIPGGFGVTVFFFLSGYLITTLMRHERMRTGTLSLRDFYLRRALRILPPLYITLALAGALYLCGQIAEGADRSAVVSQALFFQNYAKLWGSENGLPLPLWSLAVEEHFYLLFPLAFVLWLGRMDGRKAALWCLLACAVPLAVRFLNAAVLADWWGPNYGWTHARIDSILFGCCLAFWHNPLLDRDAWRPRLWHLALALGAILASFAVRDELFRGTIRYTLHGVALVVVFSWALQAGGLARRVLASAVLKRIALYSYSLYLVHLITLEPAVQARFALPGVPPILVSLALMLLYAELMHRFVERGAAALRRRLHGRRAGHAASVATAPSRFTPAMGAGLKPL